MDITEKTKFIIIGKYYISKTIMMSEPIQLSVFNSETSELNTYYDYEVFEFLRSEGLDNEPLQEYIDKLYGNTKEERIAYFKNFQEWEAKEKIKENNKELYVLVCDGLEWEDLVIFDNKEEAIKELQKYIKDGNPNNYRLEIMKYENNKFVHAHY